MVENDKLTHWPGAWGPHRTQQTHTGFQGLSQISRLAHPKFHTLNTGLQRPGRVFTFTVGKCQTVQCIQMLKRLFYNFTMNHSFGHHVCI